MVNIPLIATTLKGDWEQIIPMSIKQYVKTNHTSQNSLRIVNKYLTFAINPVMLKDDKKFKSKEPRFIKFRDCIVEYNNVHIIHSKLAVVTWKVVHKILEVYTQWNLMSILLFMYAVSRILWRIRRRR